MSKDTGFSDDRFAAESEAMKTAKPVIQRIKTLAVKEVGGVHFDRDEVAQLRTLVDYVCRGFVGEEAREGLRTLKGKIYE